jgi:3-hydroxyacyl-CoA dehydrogenase
VRLIPDTTSYISTGWRDKAKEGLISEELVRPIPMLDQMVKEGKLGRKSGQGFYDVSVGGRWI